MKFATGEVDTKYDLLEKKFTQYFIPKRNIIHERSLFQEKMQSKEETVEEFARELQSLVEHCGYVDSDDQVRDRFVVGLQDTSVKQKLQLIEDLTLEKAVTIARQHEQVKQQLAQQQAQHQEVDEAKARFPKKSKGPFKEYEKGKPKENPCQNCGYERHRIEGKCPASGQTCNKCRRKGHFASVCHAHGTSQSQSQRRATDEVSANDAPVVSGKYLWRRRAS